VDVSNLRARHPQRSGQLLGRTERRNRCKKQVQITAGITGIRSTAATFSPEC
jgi:hypothetical protein